MCLSLASFVVSGCSSEKSAPILLEEVDSEAHKASASVTVGDATTGASLYISAGCGNCHALADAGTTGSIGPDLDVARPSFEISVDRMKNGSGPMPTFLDQLGMDGINDVAAYIDSVTS